MSDDELEDGEYYDGNLMPHFDNLGDFGILEIF